MSFAVVPEVLEVHVIPSGEVRMVPELPTATYNGLEVVVLSVVELSVLVEPSSLLLQEMIVKLKRNMEKMMSICLTWFPISGLGKPKLYQNHGDLTRKWGILLGGCLTVKN